MSEQEVNSVDRRGFLQTTATATAAATGAAFSLSAGRSEARPQDPPAKNAKIVLPKRPLGKTGIDVCMLNLGTWQNPGLDRLLRYAYAHGVRYYDTAKSYGSEPAFKRWFQAMPEVRKEIFLVTKDHPNTPRELIRQLDQRLAAMGTDYVDLFFIHGIGDGYGADCMDWPKSKELKETIDAIKKSGKAKLVGFSCHDPKRAEFLQSAAEGGIVDAIMVQYTPWLPKDDALNKALDACHERGIGLISMKQVAPFNGRQILDEVAQRAPTLKDRGLSAFQGLLHAIWTDDRIASCCVSMRNTDQIRENSLAAQQYQPLKKAELEQLRESYLAAGPTLCADCDGRCGRAGGTNAALGDLTRFLTYHDTHGCRTAARKLFAELNPEQKAWHDADLHAAREACPNHLDFAKLLPKVDRYLG